MVSEVDFISSEWAYSAAKDRVDLPTGDWILDFKIDRLLYSSRVPISVSDEGKGN